MHQKQNRWLKKKKMIEIKQLNPLLQYCLIHGGHLAEVLNARKDMTKK